MPCSYQIPHLNSLHERMFERGLVVVGVTGGEVEEVEKYVAKHEIQYPIAIGFTEGFEVKGIPHAFLIDPKGKIVWRGHPGNLEESLIDKTLEGARPATLAAGLEEVGVLRRQGKHGAAYVKANELLAAGGLGAEAVAQAREMVAGAEATVQRALTEAQTAVEAKDIYLAHQLLVPVARSYQGVPGAEKAAARVEELLADAGNRREIEAGRRFQEIREIEMSRDYDAAYEQYRALVRQHGRTKAAREARERERAIKAEGKLGFLRGCGACEALDKACDMHKGRRR